MNKILITIYVITLDEEFDLLLPIGIPMKQAINLIQESIYDLSNGNYQKQEAINLYNSDGLLINQNNIVRLSGLKNGTKVILA